MDSVDSDVHGLKFGVEWATTRTLNIKKEIPLYTSLIHESVCGFLKFFVVANVDNNAAKYNLQISFDGVICGD